MYSSGSHLVWRTSSYSVSRRVTLFRVEMSVDGYLVSWRTLEHGVLTFSLLTWGSTYDQLLWGVVPKFRRCLTSVAHWITRNLIFKTLICATGRTVVLCATDRFKHNAPIMLHHESLSQYPLSSVTYLVNTSCHIEQRKRVKYTVYVFKTLRPTLDSRTCPHPTRAC